MSLLLKKLVAITEYFPDTDWLPRLERLAELRGLDTFEKNVLLVLTGSMVSKNLRNTGMVVKVHQG